MVSLARAGYGLATLPRAAIAASLASGELIVVDNLPELAPVPIIASWRHQSEAKLTESVVQLAVEAARAFSSEGGPGVVVVDDHRI